MVALKYSLVMHSFVGRKMACGGEDNLASLLFWFLY